jgi:hypothetical protein
MSEPVVIEIDEWEEKFHPQIDEGDAFIQYPTFNSIPEGTDLHHVWAVMDVTDQQDCECELETGICHCFERTVFVIIPGWHIMMDVLYYVVTDEPWADEPVTTVHWD